MCVTLHGLRVRIDKGIDVSFAVFEEKRITAFGIEGPQSRDLYSIAADHQSGCTCQLLTFSPHAHGTHIESSAHISRTSRSTLARLDSLPPLLLTRVVTMAELEAMVPRTHPNIEALFIRTGWLQSIVGVEHSSSEIDLRLHRSPFVDRNLMGQICTAFPNLRVLGIDSISVDPTADDGALLSHRRYFFHGSEHDQDARFIIELLCMPDDLESGLYAMCVNAAAVSSDAIPCRPVLYPCVEMQLTQ